MYVLWLWRCILHCFQQTCSIHSGRIIRTICELQCGNMQSPVALCLRNTSSKVRRLMDEFENCAQHMTPGFWMFCNHGSQTICSVMSISTSSSHIPSIFSMKSCLLTISYFWGESTYHWACDYVHLRYGCHRRSSCYFWDPLHANNHYS